LETFMIQTRPVFTLTLNVPTIQDLGATPYGVRKIATVAGGSFDGERLRGTVVAPPGGDWLLLRNDGVLCLDVRLTLKTDDGDLIYMHYNGMRHGPKEVIDALGRGEAVDPSTYYMRAVPVFETASAKYAWLNRAVFVANGRRVASGPIYDVFEVL
jgi:Protein of unknown function (DUF3237)